MAILDVWQDVWEDVWQDVWGITESTEGSFCEFFGAVFPDPTIVLVGAGTEDQQKSIAEFFGAVFPEEHDVLDT